MDDTPDVDDGPQVAAGRPLGGRRLTTVLALAAVLVVAVDQVTKAWAVAALAGRGRVPIIDGVMWLNLTRNPGAAFSFATGMTWFFTVVATVVAIVIVRISRRLGNIWWALALGLLLGGAVGNLIDRLFRAPGFARGHVVDFLEWPHWPVFNVADSCVVTAAVAIGLLGLLGIGVDGSRDRG